MRRYFKAFVGKYEGDDWLLAFGHDGKQDWFLTTNFVHASELSLISDGAGGDCELTAALLNWYHNDPKAAKILAVFKKKLDKDDPE